METFQINKRAQKTAYKHIQAQSFEIEHYRREYIACRKDEAIQKIGGYYENFVLYGIGGFIYSAQNGAGDIQNVVDYSADYTAKKTYHKYEKLHNYAHKNLGYSAPAIFRDLRASHPLRAIFISIQTYNRANSPSRGAGLHKWGALTQKRGFACAENYLNSF